MSNLPVYNSINSCIHIKQKRISRRRTIPEYISFDLNRNILTQISDLRNSQQHIYFSADNLAEFRYFFLLNSSVNSGLGITFKTYYSQREKKIAMIKTVINLSGKAKQYIRSDALERKEIIDVHYWLIEEILKKVPLQSKKSKTIVLRILLGLIITLVTLLIFFLIPIVWWVKALLLLVISIIIFKLLPFVLNKYLYSLVLEQLLFGMFSYSLKRKKIGLSLLEILHN